MMVAGTYVLTDTIDQSFDEIFTESNEGIDAVVTSKEAVETEDGHEPPIAGERARRGPRRRGRARRPRAGSATRRWRSSTRTASALGGGGAPTFGASRPAPSRFDPLDYAEGGKPAADDEVVIDKAAAENEGFELGDQVTIAGKERGQAVRRWSGSRRSATSTRSAARRIAVLTLPEAQRITGKEGQFDQITVAAAERDRPRDGSPQNLADGAARRRRGRDRRGEHPESQKDDIGEFIGFLKTALLVFAGVALFVAAFLIFNTFSITVAQRTREFAMLRTLGANRRQIIASVVVEAFAIGLVASVLGLLAGIGFAPVDRRAVRGARDRPAEHGHRGREPHRDRRARRSAPASPCWRR